MMEDIVPAIEQVMPREELMLYQVQITVSVVMNILMHIVLDTKLDIMRERLYRERYMIGLNNERQNSMLVLRV
jgi:hypothetical protein